MLVNDDFVTSTTYALLQDASADARMAAKTAYAAYASSLPEAAAAFYAAQSVLMQSRLAEAKSSVPAAAPAAPKPWLRRGASAMAGGAAAAAAPAAPAWSYADTYRNREFGSPTRLLRTPSVGSPTRATVRATN